MIAHKASNKILVSPSFFKNFIGVIYLIRKYKKFVIYYQFITKI
jgi:hypothetical protein